MLRSLMVFAIFMVILTIASPSGCDLLGGSGSGSEHSSAQPAVEFSVAAVSDLGVVERNDVIRARDCGFSARFQGRSVWIFGDTILDMANQDNQKVLCNSWSATYDIDAGDGLAGFQERVDDTGAPVAFFPLTGAERAYNLAHADAMCDGSPCKSRWAIWPGSIVVDAERDWAYIFYHKVRVLPGDLNFVQVGHSIAIWKNYSDPAQRPEFDLVAGFPTLFFDSAEGGYGSATVQVGDQLYAYGCGMDEESLTFPCQLGRVAMKDILQRSSWSFYDGKGGWSTDSGVAGTVFFGNEMMTIFYEDYLQRFVAVYSQPLENRVMMRTASAPHGPWTQPLELFTAKEPAGGELWVYDALAHPDFSPGNGRIYITYTRQTAPAASEMRLVAVDLKSSYPPAATTGDH